MTLSSKLSPGFVKWNYSGTGLPHFEIIPINFASPPTPGVLPDLLTSSGATKGFDVFMGEWYNAISDSYAPDTLFGIAEIYKVDATTGIRTFLYALDSDSPGTSSDPQQALVMATWSFKTIGGGILKVTAMEGVYAENARNVGRVPPGPRQTVIDYIVSGDNCFYGRDNSYPLAFKTFTSKINDKLRKAEGFRDV